MSKQIITWDKDDIVNKLRKEICEVTFLKVNGERRVMQCTLNPSMIPMVENTSETKRTKKENPEVLAVYDTTAQGWRSFRWDLLESVSGEIA